MAARVVLALVAIPLHDSPNAHPRLALSHTRVLVLLRMWVCNVGLVVVIFCENDLVASKIQPKQ